MCGGGFLVVGFEVGYGFIVFFKFVVGIFDEVVDFDLVGWF